MALTQHKFETEKETDAFKKGVDYVNDSSCYVVEIKQDDSVIDYPWIVICEDSDS